MTYTKMFSLFPFSLTSLLIGQHALCDDLSYTQIQRVNIPTALK